MTAIDFHRGNARVVHQLDERVSPYAPPTNVLYLSDVLALADGMKAAGYDPGDVVAHIDAVQAAVNEVITGDSNRWLNTDELMSSTPAEVAERVRQAGIDRATYLEQQNIRNGLDSTLARAAARSLAEGADAVVESMRAQFEPAAQEVQRAAAVGLTPFTDTTTLLDTASPDVIDAYRALGPAVAALNNVMSLRNQLTTLLGVGPSEYPMAAFVTDVPTVLDLEGAQNVWRGETEVVQHETGFVGSHLARVRAKQLGGGWLALVVGGYKLRLNTGTEAAQVVANAQRSAA